MCSDVVNGRALVFDLLSAVDIVGLRVSPLAVILEPKLRIVHDLWFASAGCRTSVNGDTEFFFRVAVRARPRSARGGVVCVLSAADARP